MDRSRGWTFLGAILSLAVLGPAEGASAQSFYRYIAPDGAVHFTNVPSGDGRFQLETSAGTRFDAATVVLAAGLGAFQPRRLRAKGAEEWEEKRIHYRVRDPERFAGKNLVILGGGDSALDWTLELHGKAKSITLVHRRAEYRAQPLWITSERILSGCDAARSSAGPVASFSTKTVASVEPTASSTPTRSAVHSSHDGG